MMPSPMGYLRAKLRHYPLHGVLLDGLTPLGVTIRPFDLMLTRPPGPDVPPPATALDDRWTGFLGEDDMAAIGPLPHRHVGEGGLRERLRAGHRCFGVKERGEVVCFAWCAIDACAFPGYAFPLRDDEAYAFDSHTRPGRRGGGAAALLLHGMFRALGETGRTRIYSIAVRYNRPSVRLIRKLDTRVADSGVLVTIFGRRLAGGVTPERVEDMRRRTASD